MMPPLNDQCSNSSITTLIIAIVVMVIISALGIVSIELSKPDDGEGE